MGCCADILKVEKKGEKRAWLGRNRKKGESNVGRNWSINESFTLKNKCPPCQERKLALKADRNVKSNQQLKRSNPSKA